MRQQLRLPGFQKRQPGGGEVETGRGKKTKKAGWHVTLGIKDVIFAGIGLVGLLMMSFALGALAGRGDIYRAAYSWGLLAPDGAKVAQWMPVPGSPAVAPAGTPGTATSTTVAAAVAPPPAAAPGRRAGALNAGGRGAGAAGSGNGVHRAPAPSRRGEEKGQNRDHAP